jgi:uncharacterized protein (DUF2249 family)
MHWKYHRFPLPLRVSLALAEEFELAVEQRGQHAKQAAIKRGEIKAATQVEIKVAA